MIGTFRLHYATKARPGPRWGLHHEESGEIFYLDEIKVLMPSVTEGPSKVPGIPSFVMKIERAQMVFQDHSKRRVALVPAPR